MSNSTDESISFTRLFFLKSLMSLQNLTITSKMTQTFMESMRLMVSRFRLRKIIAT